MRGDALLLLRNIRKLREFEDLYFIILDFYDRGAYSTLKLFIDEEERSLSRIFLDHSQFNKSLDSDLEDFLMNYRDFYHYTLNGLAEIKKNSPREDFMHESFRRSRKIYRKIKQNEVYWALKLDIDFASFQNINYDSYAKYDGIDEEDPLDLEPDFLFSLTRGEDGSLSLKGKTRLEDGSRVRVFIFNDDYLMGTNVVGEVEDGKLSWPSIKAKRGSFPAGSYSVQVIITYVPNLEEGYLQLVEPALVSYQQEFEIL